MDGRLMSEDGALDYEGFTDLLYRLFSNAWGDGWGTFTEEFPSTTTPSDIAYPIITYSVVEMQPAMMGKNVREIKPRVRSYNNVVVNGKSEDVVKVLAQRLDYVIEFRIWEENNKKLEELSKRFRDFMKSYTGYIMKKGTPVLLFQRMERKETNVGDNAVSQSHYYLVRLEEITIVPSMSLSKVTQQVDYDLTVNDLMSGTLKDFDTP